jgi:hypothetical protein
VFKTRPVPAVGHRGRRTAHRGLVWISPTPAGRCSTAPCGRFGDATFASGQPRSTVRCALMGSVEHRHPVSAWSTEQPSPMPGGMTRGLRPVSTEASARSAFAVGASRDVRSVGRGPPTRSLSTAPYACTTALRRRATCRERCSCLWRICKYPWLPSATARSAHRCGWCRNRWRGWQREEQVPEQPPSFSPHRRLP